jgi:hypothetical protein
LIFEVPWDDEEDIVNQASILEFLEDEPSHYGFPSSRVIGQKEAKLGVLQHVVIDSVDLMR